MINAENEKEVNKDEKISDLNDLLQRTYEFDIFKHVSRGLIKCQQNYEIKLNELKEENLTIKKEMSLLKAEIEILKGKTNQLNYDIKNDHNEIDIDIQNIKEEIKNKHQDNKIFRRNQNNEGGYNNINLTIDSHLNKNKKGQNEFNSEINKDENIYSDAIDGNKFNDEKDGENSNESMIKMANSYINELVNENIVKKKKHERNQNEKLNNQNSINNDNINNELKFIKSKLEEIDKEFNQFKLRTTQTISENNNNFKTNLSSNILKLKEESKKELNTLNEGINQKINILNDTTKNLSEKSDINEKLMNKTNTINNSFLTKMEIINTKLSGCVSNIEFEKFKNMIKDYIENENKDFSLDISLIKKSINAIKSELLNIANNTTEHDNMIILKQKQESTSALVERLLDFQRELREKEKKRIHLDTSKFVDNEVFNEYQKNQMKIIDKIKRENSDIGRELTEIKIVELSSKANLKDLKNLEDNIMSKMEETINKIKDKFVEKKYLNKFIKIIDYQTKQNLEEFKLSLKPGKNWMLAKKPIGHLCASCEAFIGEGLKTPKENDISWNKYASKASGDNKNIKLGVGFSKIIEMATNSEKDKYISLPVNKMNIFNGRHNSCNNKKRNADNEDIINYNSSNNTSKINRLNIENNNNSQIEEFETDFFNGSLPQIRKKELSQNSVDDKSIIKKKIKSLKEIKKYKEIEDNSDYIIKANTHRTKKNEIMFGPKITKILKKINNDKNNENQLIDENKKGNE